MLSPLEYKLKIDPKNFAYTIKLAHHSQPTIFISHQKSDKLLAQCLAEYLSECNINYYLDIEDSSLQVAQQNQNDLEMIKLIQTRILQTTHNITIVSENTKKSYWIPYEIGYSHAFNKPTANLIDKGVNELPSILSLSTNITHLDGIHSWLTYKGIALSWSEHRKIASYKTFLSQNQRNLTFT
jgi:hypothetical protein